MMSAMDTGHPRRVIEVNQQIIGPTAPRAKTVRPRKRGDYPHVAAAYLDVAQRLASPLRMGPPICDELMALVQHLFTEEEAGVVRHLGLYRGRRAADVARAERRPVEQVKPVLERLVHEKRVIAAGGPPEDQHYRLLPIVPGIFEMLLIGYTPETMTDWHRRFVELFEALCDTGYILDYEGRPAPIVRFLPVGKVIEAHPAALPSDKLEVVLDRFQTFGIGQCQCRMSMQVLGRGCGKPLGNCTVMGQWAERGIEEGVLRPVSRKEALDIKREAESHGLVNWIMNVESTKGQCSCSCCGCCCHAMRTVNEFSARPRLRHRIFYRVSIRPSAFRAASAPRVVRWARSWWRWGERGTGTVCRNGPPGAWHKRRLSPFPPRIGTCKSVASVAGCACWRAIGSGRW